MDVIAGDRRTDHRYDMGLPLRYRLLRGSRMLFEGSGLTTNMSRGGVAFRPGRFLPSGLTVELFIDWPIRLHGRDPIQLQIMGRIIRSDGEETAVKTTSHEFVRLAPTAASEVPYQPEALAAV